MITLLPNQKVEFTLGVILVVKHMQSKNVFGPNHLLEDNALHQNPIMLFASPRIRVGLLMYVDNQISGWSLWTSSN